MKQQTYRFWIASGISLLCLAAISPTLAQIVEDATLPVNSAVDTSEDNVSSITGGTVTGRNLFHSFQQFNIDEGQTADFVSPSTAIQNILVRVTGGSSSKIEGTLSTGGVSKPNLFLINPSGIVFGPNASLEVGGSFVATTANAIEFGNQGLFSASAPNSPGLLTVNPSALFFNQIATSSIENNSIAPAGFVEQSGLELSGLRVPDQRSLLLVGGNVTLDSGQLHALGGRIELGGLAGAGTIGLNVEDNNLRLSYPAGVPRANVSLTNGAVVDVTATGGGNIAINARNLDLEASVLQAGIGEDLHSDGTQAGDITLNTTEAMKIARSRITNNVEFESVGNAGSILIKADSLSLTDAAELSAVTFGQGEAGGISVQAKGLSRNNFDIY
jgi:filamentous hemagglutinin family protein